MLIIIIFLFITDDILLMLLTCFVIILCFSLSRRLPFLKARKDKNLKNIQAKIKNSPRTTTERIFLKEKQNYLF